MKGKLKVGITHGDVNGISYELAIKLMQDNHVCDLYTPIYYGSPKVAAYYRKNMGVENFSLNSIQTPREANVKRCNVINCVDDAIKVEEGKETPEADAAAMKALSVALGDLDDDQIQVLTLAPQNVGAYKVEGVSGLVEYLARRYNNKRAMPLLVGESLRIGFVTADMPIKNISKSIDASQIYNKLRVLNDTLIRDFNIACPRIAVLGLNPQSGTNCTMGEEETNIIVPAIERARANNVMALGPYSADTIFSGSNYRKFDAVLVQFYDQGMIPFRAIEDCNGAMLVAGLPVVVTTTVSGVGYDIVGKDQATEQGLNNAVYLAMDVYRNRSEYAELTANPLPHYDIAANEKESDLNVEQIAGVRDETPDL